MKCVSQGGTRLRWALAFFAAILLCTFTGAAQTTNGLSDAEIKGRQLALDILQETPTENVTHTGTLRIRDSKGKTVNILVTFWTEVKNGDWTSLYRAVETNQPGEMFILYVVHQSGLPNQYKALRQSNTHVGESLIPSDILTESQIWAPFANSDFWIADLGLEFFHWPQQKVIKHESRRTRRCTVLESTNFIPSPGAYSRVVTWIDDESHAIVWAEAYDANNKLLKEFDPKKIKKVHGQWELEEMDIRNKQTGSRTWITFDLNSKA